MAISERNQAEIERLIGEYRDLRHSTFGESNLNPEEKEALDSIPPGAIGGPSSTEAAEEAAWKETRFECLTGEYSDRALSTRQESLLVEIGTLLGRECAFSSPVDLAVWLSNEWDPETASLLDERPGSLLTPRVWKALFSTPICLRSPRPVTATLGGAYGLKIVSRTIDADFWRVSLTGTIPAVATRSRAVRSATRSCEEVLGAGLALELFDVRRVLPGAETPEIPFETFVDGSRGPCSMEPDTSRTAQTPVSVPQPVASAIAGAFLVIDEPMTALDRERKRKSGEDSRTERLLRHMERLFRSELPRAAELRHSATLLLRAAIETEPGPAISAAFTCLEATLLDKRSSESTTSRLAEAVAFRVGRTSERRDALRSEVKRLYADRSAFTHTGTVSSSVAFSSSRVRSVDLAATVLRLELEDFPG